MFSSSVTPGKPDFLRISSLKAEVIFISLCPRKTVYKGEISGLLKTLRMQSPKVVELGLVLILFLYLAHICREDMFLTVDIIYDIAQI